MAAAQPRSAFAQDASPPSDAPVQTATPSTPASSATEATAPTTAPVAPPPGLTTQVIIDPNADALAREQAEFEQSERPADLIDAPEDVVIDPNAPMQATASPGDINRPADSLGHRYQVGLRAGFGIPYVFAIKYGDGPDCGRKAKQTFCRYAGSLTLDADVSFGVSDSLEITALARIGLTEDEASGASPLGFGLGVRGYTSPHSLLKFFFAGRAFLDVTQSSRPDWKPVDFGIRGEFGLQIDVARYFGIYLQIGETLSFLRSFYFVTDATAGIQLRFP